VSRRNDRPKQVVQARFPEAKAVKLKHGFAVKVGRETIGKGKSAWSAWNNANKVAHGIDRDLVKQEVDPVELEDITEESVQSQPKLTDEQAQDVLARVNARLEEEELSRTNARDLKQVSSSVAESQSAKQKSGWGWSQYIILAAVIILVIAVITAFANKP